MRWGCSAKCEQIEAKFPTCQRCFAHMSVPLQNDDSAQGVGNRTEMRVTCAVGTVRAQSARMWGMSGQFRVSFAGMTVRKTLLTILMLMGRMKCSPDEPTGRAYARPMTGSAKSGIGFTFVSRISLRSSGLRLA